jgi:hypothetical protein
VGGSNEADLASLLKVQAAEPDGILSSATELLNSMNSSPSCNRIAASRLLISCQSISGSGNGQGSRPAEALDHVKSLYAARLAICEITGAGAPIPEQCSSTLTSRSSDTLFQSPYGEDQPNGGEKDIIQAAQLERCLKSLEARPQWWTSYSNNRQNAVVMCQAARIEIDREELLNLHKTLTGVTFGLTNTLNQSLHSAESQAVQHKLFVETVDSIRLRLMRNLENDDLSARSRLSKFLNDIEAGFREAAVGATAAMAEVESDATNLKKV